jgi:DNA-binding CsgD family transcriptional regulator
MNTTIRKAEEGSGATIPITGRERQVLLLLREGFNSRQIADSLKVSVTTIRTYEYHLRKKFEVKNRLALVRKVERMGYFSAWERMSPEPS